MIILNVEVIDCYRRFENLVLNFFDNDVFSVDKDENVTRAELCCL